MSNVIVPSGPNTATVQVLDANGADITGTCSIAATSSDSTVVSIGSPDPATPATLPITAVGAPGSTATLTYTAMNSAGTVTQTDTLTVQITAPATMVITYGTTIPAAALHKKK